MKPTEPADATEPSDAEMVLRTIAMPGDANANGDIFGGWLVSQMDIGGAILARATSHSRVTTVAIDSMSFLRPVNMGDVVSCYARLLAVGRTSMRIDVDVWAQRWDDNTRVHVTEGIFTYVAIDKNGKPHPVRR